MYDGPSVEPVVEERLFIDLRVPGAMGQREIGVGAAAGLDFGSRYVSMVACGISRSLVLAMKGIRTSASIGSRIEWGISPARSVTVL